MKTIVKETLVTPVEGADHMPYQVATNLLTEPKARLTNRMRKNCNAAREIVYSSARPHRYDEEHKNRIAGAVAKPVDTRILNRMKKSTTPQLLKWEKRIKARRRNVQEKYLKTQGKVGPKWERIRLTLEAIARQCDMTRDIIEDVLLDRLGHYKLNDSPANHVHPRRFRDYLHNKPNKKLCLAA